MQSMSQPLPSKLIWRECVRNKCCEILGLTSSASEEQLQDADVRLWEVQQDLTQHEGIQSIPSSQHGSHYALMRLSPPTREPPTAQQLSRPVKRDRDPEDNSRRSAQISTISDSTSSLSSPVFKRTRTQQSSILSPVPGRICNTVEAPTTVGILDAQTRPDLKWRFVQAMKDIEVQFQGQLWPRPLRSWEAERIGDFFFDEFFDGNAIARLACPIVSYLDR